MYKVIKSFDDVQDVHDGWYHRYAVGNSYPREGYEPTEERIKILASDRNAQRTPLIELVRDENDQSTEPVAEPVKARRGRKRG